MCLKIRLPKMPKMVMAMMGFKKILLTTEIAILKRGVGVASIEITSVDRLLPISISTKLMGFKIAKLMGAIRYRYEAYSGCVFSYKAATEK